jgi:hypothetical protein
MGELYSEHYLIDRPYPGYTGILPREFIDSGREKIEELNKIIESFCPNMKITLDTKINNQKNTFISYNLPDDAYNNYLLCLMVNNICVSSIEFSYETEVKNGIQLNFISIDSATIINFESEDGAVIRGFEGLGYNSILRSALVIVALDLQIDIIRSSAKNPQSKDSQIKLGAIQIGDKKFQILTELNVKKKENQDLAYGRFMDSLKKYSENQDFCGRPFDAIKMDCEKNLDKRPCKNINFPETGRYFRGIPMPRSRSGRGGRKSKMRNKKTKSSKKVKRATRKHK